jgi:hypothetical protein
VYPGHHAKILITDPAAKARARTQNRPKGNPPQEYAGSLSCAVDHARMTTNRVGFISVYLWWSGAGLSMPDDAEVGTPRAPIVVKVTRVSLTSH